MENRLSTAQLGRGRRVTFSLIPDERGSPCPGLSPQRFARREPVALEVLCASGRDCGLARVPQPGGAPHAARVSVPGGLQACADLVGKHVARPDPRDPLV